MDYYQRHLKHVADQHYQAIRKSCIEQSKLFEDPVFKLEPNNLFLNDRDCSDIVWKRPGELCNEPHLTIGGTSSMDLICGENGSSSFVAACSVLANYEHLWKRVLPDLSTQEWSASNPGNYSGVFRFRFWKFGSWNEIIVDDRLPVKNNQLYGIRSNEANEFWSPLMEKAYAKLLGCYEALHLLDSGSILQDLTGGILHPVHIPDVVVDESSRQQLFTELTDSENAGMAMITCWIHPPSPAEDGEETPEGLLLGRTYAISAIKDIKLGTGLLSIFKSDRIKLVRLRNAEGAKEWIGPWSDNSLEWKEISNSEKKKMGLTFDGDGEFWMSFDDFCKYFTDLTVCRLMHTTRLIGGDVWRESFLFGSWIPDDNPNTNTAGGCLETNLVGSPEQINIYFYNVDTFLQNPQYRFDVPDDSKGHLMVQLQQRDIPYMHNQHPELEIVGFHIARIESNRIFKLHKKIESGVCHPYLRQRCVFAQVNLKKGRYVIIPTTQDPKISTDFLLRIYSQSPLSLFDLRIDYPDRTCWAFCTGYPTHVTSAKVVCGRSCAKPDGSVGNIYVTIGCEGQFVKSKTFKNNADPKFDVSGVFYRKKADSAIVFCVYNDGIVCDSFLGQGCVSGSVDATANSVEVPLFGRGKLAGKRMPGTLVVDVITCDDIYAL